LGRRSHDAPGAGLANASSRPTDRANPEDRAIRRSERLFDLKYDGFRGLCYLEQGRSRMISRNGNLMSRFAGLGDQIAASLDVNDAILDGEPITADETGRPQFYDLLRHMRAPAYGQVELIGTPEHPWV